MYHQDRSTFLDAIIQTTGIELLPGAVVEVLPTYHELTTLIFISK